MKFPPVSFSYRMVIMLGGIALHGMGLALPLFMMQLYDRILPNNSVYTMIWMAVFVVLALFLDALLRIVRNNLADWHIEHEVHGGRRRMIQSMLVRPGGGHRKKDLYGDLQFLVNDAYRSQSFFWADVPFGFMYLGLIFVIHPVLGLFMTFLGLGHMSYLMLARKAYRESNEYRRFAREHRESFVCAVLDNLPEFKALGAEEQVLQHHAILFSRSLAAERDMNRNLLWKNAITMLMATLPVFGAVILGGFFVIRGELTLGAVTAAVLLARRALSPLQGFGERWFSDVDRQHARKSLDLLQDLPSREGSGPDRLFPLSCKAKLEFHDLSIRGGPDLDYQGTVPSTTTSVLEAFDDHVLLRVEDCTLEAGSFACIPPRCGDAASLLFQAVRGIHPWYSGEIIVGSYQTSRYTSAQTGKQIVLLQDHEVLLPGTLMENMSSFEPALVPQARDAAAMLGLEAWFEHLEQGVDTMVNDAVLNGIPGNIVQRMALARALALRPGILMLDRFDETLDGDSQQICREVLMAVQPFFTMIYSGRDEVLASRADMIADIREGVLMFSSPGREKMQERRPST